MKNHFETLSSLNVNDKVEKKNNLTYLSWAWAWAEVKKKFPDATYSVVKFENNLPYVFDESTGYMVFTSVTIEDVTHEMWLPVMDGANKAMMKSPYTYKSSAWVNGQKQMVEKTVESATMFDINKTVMRCLTKNLAMFGLGLYIYAGEDLPDTDSVEVKPNPATATNNKPNTAPKAVETKKLIELKIGDVNWVNVLKYIADNKSLGLEAIVSQIERKYSLKATVKKEIKKEVEK